MIVLGLEALFTGLSIRAFSPEEVIFWQRCKLGATALVPGIWLIFSLIFTQRDYKPALAKWKWIVLLIFLSHLALVTSLSQSFFQGSPTLDSSHGWFLQLSWAGQIFYVFFISSITFIIMLLEKTLRTSTGLKRWKIKFLVLGIGSVFGARVYTVSMVLLFGMVNLQLEAINTAALLVANVFVLISMSRARALNTEIYFSHSALYNSITIVIVGLYFIAVGVMAKVIRPLDGLFSFPIRSFFIFVALLCILVLLLSDSVRQKAKRFIGHHFRKPQYDYRSAWRTFAQRTAPLVEVPSLCYAVCKIASEILHIPTVSIWLVDDSQKKLALGGSTLFSENEVRKSSALREGSAQFIRMMADQEKVVDFETFEAAWLKNFKESYPHFFRKTQMRYCLPLKASDDLVGFISLADRNGEESFSLEEQDLIQTIAAQAAASLLNLKLTERLRQVSEMEAFQTIAAFFVHDLKNLAANLSVMLQNMPVHFDNPEFREDSLQTLSKSVKKINGLCTRISSIKGQMEIQPVATDLNKVVETTLASLDGLINATVVKELPPVPVALLDPEHIKKVLTNLILNASEAVPDKGEIIVTTKEQDNWVVLTVSDNGCGMSQEIMDECLFKPFKTTKTKGMGIGLFQSKMIVDAHQGRIEVESEEGVGSTFRVLLPIQEA
jgi:putative PEP-CTERM system histidine kinase